VDTRILQGDRVALEIRGEVAREVESFVALGNPRPRLAVILAGEDPASQVYVRNKIKACAEAGIESEMIRLEGGRDGGRVLASVRELNRREDVDGILVQLPLPPDADESTVLQALDPEKDVDGLHPLNAGRLLLGMEGIRPCTPSGIMELLRRSGIETTGRSAVVIGRSEIVGKPMALLLLQANATVTVCHSRTRDLPSVTSGADILVVAAGKPGLVTESFIRDGAVVIDVGIHRLQREEQVLEYFGPGSTQIAAVRRGKSVLVGDVHPRRVAGKAGALTPVPGGVGPLTIACLLQNTLKAARRRRGLPAEA
jgi:methylenetetrahydrofolate dehydrogenase (NADP+) / methenyltetrahydrofolate cyclohydrolase